MVVELRSAGVATDDYGVFTTLRPTSFDYQRAVPILLAWPPRIDRPEGKETIARSLTGQPEARRLGAARVLVDQFRLLGKHVHTKWAFANALATLADATVADDLIALLRSPEHGHSREMLC